MTQILIDPDTWATFMSGALNETQEIAFWQSLIDSGAAWNMGSAYSRKAMGLILSQRCHQSAPKGTRRDAPSA